MKNVNKNPNVLPSESNVLVEDTLTQLCRKGAQRMLSEAIELEVQEYIERHKSTVDHHGHRMVVRNGHHPERNIQTAIGDIAVRKPKVNDKRLDNQGQRIRFQSSIIPPYLKRSKSMEEFIPWLYLRGISTGDFTQAFQALLGTQAKGLSASTVVRLKEQWICDYQVWSRRDLSEKEYVYIWADGVYPRIRLDDSDSQCFLVILGATKNGKKELLAIEEGARESKISWRDVLLGLKERGLETPPKIAVADGAMGFWSALDEVYPNTDHQRCWVHKTCNVLDKLPKSQQSRAKSLLHEIWMAETQAESEKAFDHFIKVYKVKYEKAAHCLEKDREELLSFYNYPAEHWKHLRTSNPIESMFATIRLRTKRTKGHGNAKAALTMAFKLAECAEKKWNRLSGYELLADVVDAKYRFVDGIRKAA